MMQPVYFVSHGAPNIVTVPSPAQSFLRRLDIGATRPRAILVASAHWETAAPRVTGSPAPPTIHDFGNFGPELFRLRYPAPGDPVLAETVVRRLKAAGLDAAVDPSRGLDHGVWTPLMLMRPQADVPVLQVSIQPAEGVEGALRLGRALASLREDGVAIVGSGALTHNLREVDWQGGERAAPFAAAFAQWAADRIAANDLDALSAYRTRAPEAVRNHPEEEHLLPLFVAIGAGGLDGAERLHASFTFGALAMDAYRFGASAPVRQSAAVGTLAPA